MNVIPFIYGNINLKVRVDNDGEPWFHANTICEALGFTNPRQALINHVESDDVTQHDTIDSLGRNQLANFVNESGLYALIFGSKSQEARHFKRWVTHDVLPTIRKTGGYGGSSSKTETPQAPNLAQMLQESLTLLKEAQTQNSRLISLLAAPPIPAPTPAPSVEPPTKTLQYAVSANVERRHTALYEALKAGPVLPSVYAKQTHTTKQRVLNDIYGLRYRGISIKTLPQPGGDAIYQLVEVPAI